LKYPDAILATYKKKRWMKHLKHASKTPEKALEKIANICISR
jgi:hypothetical protein